MSYMPTDLHDLAVKRHAIDFLAEARVRNLSDLKLHALSWNDLCGVHAAAKRKASTLAGVAAKIEGTPQAEGIDTALEALVELVTAADAEKDARTAAGSREARNEAQIGDPRRPHGESISYPGNPDGAAYEEARATVLEPEQRYRTWAEAQNPNPYRGLTLGSYLRSMVTGAKTDTERRALAEGTDSAGGYTVPTMLAAEMIDLLRANLVVAAAGARTVPLMSDNHTIAKVASDPVPAWRAENAAVAESAPTFAPVTFAPRSLAVLAKASRELLEDSLNIERVLPEIMAAAMAREFDRVALLGTGTAPEPRGVANTVGIGTEALAGSLAYAPLLRARTAILTANAGPMTAAIMHPRDEGTVSALVDSTGQPLAMPRALESVSMLTTTGIPTDGGVGTDESTVICGNFRHLYVGVRSAIRIDILRETFAGNHQFGFVAHMRGDVAVAHPGAFYTITGVTD